MVWRIRRRKSGGAVEGTRMKLVIMKEIESWKLPSGLHIVSLFVMPLVGETKPFTDSGG